MPNPPCAILARICTVPNVSTAFCTTASKSASTDISHLWDIIFPSRPEASAHSFSRFSILLAHGGDESHIPINKDILKWSGFDYIALGHIHKPEIIFEDLMAYSGSLEPLDRTETGSHGFIEGEISEEKQQIEFVPFAKRMYIQVEVMITEEMSASEIKDRIETELSYRGKDNIYEVVLTGSIDSEIEIDFDDIKEDYLISDIIYETKSRWDYDQLAEENDLMIQKVAEILKEEPQALTFAMEALSYARER